MMYSVFESTVIHIWDFNSFSLTIYMLFSFFGIVFMFYNFLFLLSNMKMMIWYKIYSLLLNYFYTIAYSYLNKNNFFMFFPFLFYIFNFVFFQNLISLMPSIFATTSHFSFTFSICINIWLIIITLGFSMKTIKFFNIIIPKNVPNVLVPFLIFIEFISYIFSFISLSLRLFANMLAGHMLIHVVTSKMLLFFYDYINISNFLMTLLFFISFTMLFFFEVIVAFLQGYMLFILSLIYLTDLDTNNNH